MSQWTASLDTPAPGKCVLVVDDDAQVRQAIRWALEDEGLAVVTAADGHEALGLAVERRPDLVVLDLTLPEMNGYAVARGLRAGHARPIPILLITADGQAPLKAQRVGAYAFLRKPFRIEDLLHAVHTGLSGAGA
jgi:two-component system KDP operon response regulator KdpE